jgi:hypothetical protein
LLVLSVLRARLALPLLLLMRARLALPLLLLLLLQSSLLLRGLLLAPLLGADTGSPSGRMTTGLALRDGGAD